MHAGVPLCLGEKGQEISSLLARFAASANLSPECSSLMSGKIRGISLACRKTL